jgi:YbbR domain-containing protein
MIGQNPLNSKYFYKVPVTIKDADMLKKGDIEYMLMENKDSYTVDVKVTGLNTDLSKLTAKDIKASATMLSNFNEGTNSLLVTIEAISDMKSEVISTKYIKCNIEQIFTVSVDVSVKHKGALTDGYIINSKYSNPASIYVKGPRSIVNSVSTAEAVVDIEGKIDSISDFQPITLKDNTDKGLDTSKLSLSHSSVEVVYDILPTKRVPIKVITGGEPAEGYKLTELNPSVNTVWIAAPKQILSKITEIDTELIDIANAESHVIIDQNLKLPTGVVLVDKNQNKLKVIAVIEKLEEKEFIFDYSEIEYINKADNLIVVPLVTEDEEDKKQITVKIIAVESVLNLISKEHIKLSLDLTEAVVGSNDILLNVNLDLADVVIESISSDAEFVNVILEKLEVVE